MVFDMAFDSQNPGLSMNVARSRTKGSLIVTSIPLSIHNVKVASPLRPKENQPKPAIEISMLLTTQLVPEILTSLSAHLPISEARSTPMGG